MLSYHCKLLAAVGGSFTVEGVTFDGTNDYLTRGSGLTGAVDGKEGTISFWIKPHPSFDGVEGFIFSDDGQRLHIRKLANNTIQIQAETAGGSNILDMTSTATVTSSGGWFHVLASWRQNDGSRSLAINDVVGLTSTISDDFIDYTRSDHSIGAKTVGTDKAAIDLAEFYFAPEFLAIASTSARRKFISADGKPVNLGDDGSLPTGNQPIIYLSNRPGDSASDFATNRGSGGNFTENGALTKASTKAKL